MNALCGASFQAFQPARPHPNLLDVRRSSRTSPLVRGACKAQMPRPRDKTPMAMVVAVGSAMALSVPRSVRQGRAAVDLLTTLKRPP